MKPFDLEKALAGEPVRLKNGNKAFILHKLEIKNIKLLDNILEQRESDESDIVTDFLLFSDEIVKVTKEIEQHFN